MWSTASCRGTLTEGFSADQFAVGDTAWRSGRGSEPLAGSGAGEWWMIKKSNLERIPALLVFSSGALKPPFTNDWCWPGLPVRRRRRQRPPGLPRAERPVFEALTSASRPKAGTQTFDLHAQKQTLSELDQCNLAAPHDFSRESALLFEERLLCSKRPCASRGQPTRSIVWRSASPGRFNDLLRCRRQLCPHRTTAQPASDSTARAMDIHPAVAASGMHNTWTATLTASPAT